MTQSGHYDADSPHDNAQNPSTSFPISEPGRELTPDLTWRHSPGQAYGAANHAPDTHLDVQRLSKANDPDSDTVPAAPLNAQIPRDGRPPLPNRPSVSLRSDDAHDTFAKKAPTFSDLREQHGYGYACFTLVLRVLKNNWGFLTFLLFLVLFYALLGSLVFEPVSWKAWYALADVGIVLALMVTNKASPMIAMLLGVTALLVVKIIEPAKAFEGLANEGVITVAILFIVAEGIQRTSALVPVFRILLGKPQRLVVAQIRTMVPAAVLSAFLNNTPLVAMLIPVIQSWSRRAGFPVSKLLMPMNNAATLGGTLTLLGTSTNLVVDALAREKDILKGDGSKLGIPIFGITAVGSIVAITGLIYMVIFSRWLLRDRGQVGVESVIQNPREYTVALVVTPRAPIIGKNLEDAGLRQLRGLFLVEITRSDGTVIPAASPDTHIEAGDTLLFAGVVETVTELYHIRGLAPATAQSEKMKLARHNRRLVELVISASSGLVRKTPKESKFRSRFNAAIIAVHRHGEHVREKIADIRLRAGDTLLVETGKDFVTRFGKDANFALVAEVSGSQPPREDLFHMLLAGFTVITMVAVAAARILPLVTTAALASFIMIAFGCLSATQAGRSVMLPVIITIGASFGVANGLLETGAAEQIGKAIVSLFEPLGEIGLLLGIYFGTAVLTSVVTNNAAVALMFPIIQGILKERVKNGEVLTISSKLKALYALMLGGSSSFSTPIAYQTNLMVHGPGGYTFLDWVIFGIPMQIVLGAVGIISLRYLTFSL